MVSALPPWPLCQPLARPAYLLTPSPLCSGLGPGSGRGHGNSSREPVLSTEVAGQHRPGCLSTWPGNCRHGQRIRARPPSPGLLPSILRGQDPRPRPIDCPARKGLVAYRMPRTGAAGAWDGSLLPKKGQLWAMGGGHGLLSWGRCPVRARGSQIFEIRSKGMSDPHFPGCLSWQAGAPRGPPGPWLHALRPHGNGD